MLQQSFMNVMTNILGEVMLQQAFINVMTNYQEKVCYNSLFHKCNDKLLGDGMLQ